MGPPPCGSSSHKRRPSGGSGAQPVTNISSTNVSALKENMKQRSSLIICCNVCQLHQAAAVFTGQEDMKSDPGSQLETDVFKCSSDTRALTHDVSTLETVSF